MNDSAITDKGEVICNTILRRNFKKLGKLNLCDESYYIPSDRFLAYVIKIRGFCFWFLISNEKSECFVKRVKEWWTSYCFQGSLSFILACKLKALKVDLLVCNDVVFGNVKG